MSRPPSSDDDVRGAVSRLSATFATRRTREVAWRREQLAGVERLVTECEPHIAAAMADDLGRSPFDTWLGEITLTKTEAAHARRHVSRWMRPRRVALPLPMLPARAQYRYVPLGTVLIIAPWNYPVHLTLGPLVGALAAGNTAILKPSEHAPAVSALLAELLPRYVDPEAVTVVQGGAQVTQELLSHGLDLVFFTGSQAVAAQVLHGAAPHLTPVVLELGGKSPAIVTADADLDVAARRIVWAKLMNSGQTCIAPDYVLVDRRVRDALVDRIASSVTQMRPEGAGLRVVNSRHLDRLQRLLDGHRGRVAFGGGVDPENLTIEPTVVVDPHPDSPIMTEEIFGPLLPVVTFTRLEEAIELANRGGEPLAAYLFTSSTEAQRQLLVGLRCGGVVINHAFLHAATPKLPFGGVGTSGTGAYHGEFGFQVFSHRQAVLTKPARPDLRLLYPPHGERTQRLLRRMS